MSLLYHAYVYLEFLILACTICILAPEMAKKTMIKKVLKYAPIRTDFQKAVSMDESIKKELSVDMSEVSNENIIDMEEITQEEE